MGKQLVEMFRQVTHGNHTMIEAMERENSSTIKQNAIHASKADMVGSASGSESLSDDEEEVEDEDEMR